MITIQGFAKLCGCNAQTLRYYDRIGLLRPAKVDGWTGYRYYEEEQALTFIRIRSLKQADFSIEEIKTLLNEDEDHLMAAFDRKIREQQHAAAADRLQGQERGLSRQDRLEVRRDHQPAQELERPAFQQHPDRPDALYLQERRSDHLAGQHRRKQLFLFELKSDH